MNNQKILLLGSNGYIGSKLSIFLENNPLLHISKVDINWFNFHTKDYIESDISSLSDSFVLSHDIIILLAGHSSVQMSDNNYESTFNNNVKNFIKLCHIINNSKIKFIYASSASVYNDPDNILYDENWKTNKFCFQNSYDLTKSTIDKIIDTFNIEYYGLRFGTVNGWSPHTRNDVMLNSMVFNAINNNEIILINPDTYRSILDIDDLILAFDILLNNEKDLRGIYNLASFDITSEQAALIVSNQTNAKINLKQDTKKNYNFKLNCNKFRDNFNFKFSGNAKSLVNKLIHNYNNIYFSNRKKAINYE